MALRVSVDPTSKTVRNRRRFFVRVLVENFSPGEVCVRGRIRSQRCTFDDGSKTSEWRCKTVRGTKAGFKIGLVPDCDCSDGDITTSVSYEVRDSNGDTGAASVRLEILC